jgi:mRNA-degrading endonuclease RelE of RelBE toxin-antitoxin system
LNALRRAILERGCRATEEAAGFRPAILDQIEQVLRVNLMMESKARVKRLRQPAPTQYRLRVGEFRVFCDVDQETVLIIQVLSKQNSIDYLGGSS